MAVIDLATARKAANLLEWAWGIIANAGGGTDRYAMYVQNHLSAMFPQLMTPSEWDVKHGELQDG